MKGRLIIAAALIALVALPTMAAKKKEAAPAYSGPTESDIRAAYQTKLDWINDGTRRFVNEPTGAKLLIELTRLSMIECNPLEGYPDHYLCSVLVDWTLGGTPNDPKRVEVVLHKVSGVWTAQ